MEITPEQLKEMTEAFCERLIERGYRTGVYVNKDFYENWYGEEFFSQHPEYYVWYARPGVDKPDKDCYIWQYACDMGTEYGVDEPLDKNILMGEYLKAEIAVNCKECARLKAEMEQMEKNYEAALTGCFETIDGYVCDVHQLEEQNIMLKEKLGKLTVENGTLKETIVSLQEQLEEARQQQPKENILVKIFRILFGGA